MARGTGTGTGGQSPSTQTQDSPPPEGVQSDLEYELLGLANSLYNLGTTVVNDLSKEKDTPGGGKQVGQRVNDVIHHLATMEEMSQHIRTMIPMQVLGDIDSAKNPMILTRDRLERAAAENQFMNGKIRAIDSYRGYLNDALLQTFPDLAQYDLGSSSTNPAPNTEEPLGSASQPTLGTG